MTHLLHPKHHARETPEKLALISAATGQGLSYRQLEEQSNQVAQLFRTLGLKTGDRVPLMLENRLAYNEVCWGAERSGVTLTAMSTYVEVE